MRHSINTELFVIPDGKRYLIYSPLQRLVFETNRDTLSLLSAIKEGVDIREDARTKKTMEFLIRHKIVDGPEEKILPPKKIEKFEPTSVTIFPTSDCNLRCVYCYASAGERPREMKWDVAKAAIDFIAENAVNLGKKEIQVGFHGGGEPAVAWGIVAKSVEYAKKKAAESGLKARTQLATNGVLSDEKIEWIIKNMDRINVSFDGPRDIHDSQRVTPNGKGSFDAVMRTIKRLEETNFPYGIRVTITQASVGRMAEMVDFFHENINIKSLHFEQLSECGRCEKTKWSAPDPDVFVENFINAVVRAEKYGIEIYNSGGRIETVTDSFCGASRDSFCPTPEGFVTSCYEVSSPKDPRSETFFYGRYNEKTKKFYFDIERLQKLQERRVQNMEKCQGCFIKWHCCGDCPAKVLASSGSLFEPVEARCRVNREITKYYIKKLLHDGKLIKRRLKAEVIEC